MATRKKLRKVNKRSTKSKLNKAIEKRKDTKTNHLWFRMWVSFFVSLFGKDRGRIPNNIGNKLVVTNNLYITKLYMNSMIQFITLSLNTPITLIGEILEELRDKSCDAIVDTTFKNEYFDIKMKDSGLQSRITLWERTIKDEYRRDIDKERAARCLYTVEEAKRGKQLYKTRIFLTVRAKTASQLNEAEKIIFGYLTSIGAVYLPITSSMKRILQYTFVLSDFKGKDVKDLTAIVNSEKTLSQMLPNCGSYNGDDGEFLAVNILNASKFRVDIRSIVSGRNFYVVGPTGDGKTVLVSSIIQSGLESGFAACIQDIKGTDYTNIVQGVDGYIVSLRPDAIEYINTFKMIKEETDDDRAEMYFKTRIGHSKRRMLIMIGFVEEESRNKADTLLDEFFDAFYIGEAVVASNRNTWYETDKITPYYVYEALKGYLNSYELRERYPEIIDRVLSSLRTFMSKTGSKSYVFKKEFNHAEILRSKAILFDFGILEQSSTTVDPIIFKLKFDYMRQLNTEFVSYKSNQGIHTMAVLEESQVVPEETLKEYVEEYTLRRGALQTTFLLGNSIKALASKELAGPLIENTTALLVSGMQPEARKEIIKQFDLQAYEGLLTRMFNDQKRFKHSFLFVNRMQQDAESAVLKINIKKGKKYKAFTPSFGLHKVIK